MSKKDPIQEEYSEETEQAAEPVKEQLEEALEKIDTPEKAEAVVEQLVKDDNAAEPAVAVGDAMTPDVETASPPSQAEMAAEEIEEAAKTEPDDVTEAAKVLETTAAEAAELEGAAYEAVTDQVQAVTAPELDDRPEETLEKQRRHLRDALRKHPGVNFLKAYDTELFIFLNNHTPRTKMIDAFFYHLSAWFRGGSAWLIGVALVWPFRPVWAARTLRTIAPSIWIAGAIVEGPVKRYFRRRRPFISVVRAVVVGKKPGNWSFPSGHSAVAFAGARMLSRCSPRWRSLWYSIAGLVGFSRIYLGAHYPGDVLSGSFFGVALAEISHWIIKKTIK